jgi:hypothetical protein
MGGAGATLGSGSGGGGAGGSAGSAAGGSAGDSEPVTIVLLVDTDVDDALWIRDSDERLSYSNSNPYVEVGGDDEEWARTGLRFRLPIPVGSTIESATLRLTRREGDADADETMLVQVFDSANVPPFDDDHEHVPEEHVSGGLFARTVGGFAVGEDDQTVVSPDLTPLVAHVVERADYHEGGTLGFVVSADGLTHWAQFADRVTGPAGVASLSIRYVPP